MKTTQGIRLTILLVSGIVFSLPQIYGQNGLPESEHYKLDKLAEGVYAAIHNNEGGYAICNAGIIDLGDRTVVLDPFISPVAARDLKKHAEFLTGKPVSLVLNLDPHSDHSGGNQVFVPGADIIGTPNARKYIQDHFDREFEYNTKNASDELLKIQEQLRKASGKEETELILEESQYKAIIASLSEIKMTLPNITIKDTMILYGSQRRVILIPAGTGHTNGDMIAYLPEDKIIFMSDELFVNCHPYFGDGDPESLKNNLEKVIAMNPVIAVPGHGQVGDIKSLHVMIDYIDTLTGMVKKEIMKGTDGNKIMELPIPEKYSDWLISGLYRTNLKFLYNKFKE